MADPPAGVWPFRNHRDGDTERPRAMLAQAFINLHRRRTRTGAGHCHRVLGRAARSPTATGGDADAKLARSPRPSGPTGRDRPANSARPAGAVAKAKKRDCPSSNGYGSPAHPLSPGSCRAPSRSANPVSGECLTHKSLSRLFFMYERPAELAQAFIHLHRRRTRTGAGHCNTVLGRAARSPKATGGDTAARPAGAVAKAKKRDCPSFEWQRIPCASPVTGILRAPSRSANPVS